MSPDRRQPRKAAGYTYTKIAALEETAPGDAKYIDDFEPGQINNRGDVIAALQQAIENWIEPDRRADASQPCIDLARVYSMDRNVEQTLRVLEGLPRIDPP
jgi:hypothetical protein